MMNLKPIFFFPLLLLSLIAFPQLPDLNKGENVSHQHNSTSVLNRSQTTSTQNNLSCNDWLHIPSHPGFVTIGDLDVSGDQITVEAVFNRTSAYTGGPLYAGDLVTKHRGPSDVNYLLRPNSAEITTTDGRYFVTMAGCEIELNKTYHVAMVYDGRSLKFYRNGFLMSQVAASGNLYQNDWLTQIGFYNYLFPEYFIGYINEVRIWNIARSQGEIRTNMNTSLADPRSQTGLMAYYVFNDLINKQGDALWNGRISGSVTLNNANPTCTNFKADSCCAIPAGSLIGKNICNGEQKMLTFKAAIGKEPFILTYSDGITTFKADNVRSDVPFPVPATPVAGRHYTLQSIEDVNGCIAPSVTGITAEIVILNTPDAGLTGTTICKGETGFMHFKANKGVAPFDIVYSDGLNSYNMKGIAGDAQFAHPMPLSDTSSFTLISISDANKCLNSSPSAVKAIINVNGLPQGGISDTNGCISDSARVIFTPVSGRAPFTLTISNGLTTFNVGGVEKGGTIKLPEVLNSPSETFTLLSIREENSAGCSSNTGFTSANAVVTGHEKPQINFPQPDAICINEQPFIITGVTVTPGLAGQGYFSGKGVSGEGKFVPALAGAGAHKIRYTYASEQGCRASEERQLVVNDLPSANAGEDIVHCPNAKAQLSAAGGASYYWSPAEGLSNTSIANPIVDISDTKIYTVTVTSAEGCVAKDEVKVTVFLFDLDKFNIPNTFTPNGDGRNDCFGLSKLYAVKINQFSIYNRWGVKLFSSNDPNACWDGRYNGVEQPQGAYVYIINAITVCGNLSRKGMLMLLR